MYTASIVSGFFPKWRAILCLTFAGLLISGPALANPADWIREFPKTDFSKHNIDFGEIRSDGMTRDAIPAILKPTFMPAEKLIGMGPLEPVISVEINDDIRAYPLRILLWHELVNDVVGGMPIAVSYCPLCNSAVVFERRVDDQTLTFGNTGRLRHFDMIMYDSQTESWWQQFSGDAIVGQMTGQQLKPVASKIESFELFKGGAPEGKVLIPTDPKARDYGTTPYARMDSRGDKASQFPYAMPKGIAPLERVVVVGNEAWPLRLLADKRRIVTDSLILSWSEGQNSIHDTRWIPFGRDIGNVTVERYRGTDREDAVHDITFAFAFAAFRPDGTWHLK
jgi:hypothetical protein